MIKVDMWYGDDHKEADRIDIDFCDQDCEYRGNIYMGGKAVGDYTCDDSVELEKSFPQLTFMWE